MALPSRSSVALLLLAMVVISVVALSEARRPRPPRRPAAVYEPGPSHSPYADQHPAASGHGHHGRVQIKVYRGPDHGHHGHAPHGYWVKQPADDPPHHRR